MDMQEHVIQLNQQADLLYQQGQYEQAIDIATHACELSQQYLGEDHQVFAASLNNLAFLYVELGNYRRAEPLYLRSLAILNALLGEAHPRVAKSLDNLAWLYYMMNEYAQARACYQRVLTVQLAVLGEEHLDVARTMDNLAVQQHGLGNYAQAEPLMLQALRIRRAALGEEHPDVAQTLHNLGSLYEQVGDYYQAEALLRRALEIRCAALGENHPDTAASLSGLAGLYESMGDYTQAESFYQQALAINRMALGDGHPHTAADLNNLGGLYYKMGNYAQAEQLFQQALVTKRTTSKEDNPHVASSLNNLAMLYYALEDYRRAEQFYQQALAIWRATLGDAHPHVALNLNNLAMLYCKTGNYGQAEPLMIQALEIWRTCLGELHPHFALGLNNLGNMYREMKHYSQAEPLLYQALEVQKTALKVGHLDSAASLNNLALLYYDMGHYDQAEPLFQQMLDIVRLEVGEVHPLVAQSLQNLALVYVVTGRKTEALTLMNRAAAINDQMVGQVFSLGSENQRMGYLAAFQWSLDVFLSLILHYLSHSITAVQAGLNMVLRRKALGSEALATQRDAVLGGRYPALKPKLQELTILRMQIAQKMLSGPGLEGFQAHQRLLQEWNARKEQLEAELAHRIPEMNLARKLQTVDLQAILKTLPSGAALIEFIRCSLFDFQAVPAQGKAHWMPAHYVAFVLCAEDHNNIRLIDLGRSDLIDQQIATFRASIIGELEEPTPRHLKPASPQPVQETYLHDGVALRKAIFDPLLTPLGTRRRLYLSPDGDLTRLPFEALPTNDGHHLIDEYQISYLGVGRDMLRFEEATSDQPRDPLIAADPAFDLDDRDISVQQKAVESHGRHSRNLDRDKWYFAPLPSTRVEGERIATMLGVQPLLGGRVLERQLKSCRSPRILHMATHGFFLVDQPRDPKAGLLGWETLSATAGERMIWMARVENPLLRSGLALAGANTWLRGDTPPPEAEDGLLTAEDVSGLDLLDTELVVLSACETGLGEVRIGEGVMGLRRAFLVAGARTLVMSLWRVSDRQTQELMEDFYQRILAGQPRADALREAQLAMKMKYPHPYYWGGFICQGDPNPLSVAPPTLPAE